MAKKINILSLFSGTKSWTKYYKSNEADIISVDTEYLYSNTLCRNILDWNYKEEIKTKINVIYASPPCNLYFTNLKNLTGNTKYTEKDKQLSLDLVDKTIEIIEYFAPKIFVIENPLAKMRKRYPTILGIEYQTVYYCNYGMEYKKPTDIWTQIKIPYEKCKHKKHNVGIAHEDLFINGSVKDGNVNREQLRAQIPDTLSFLIYRKILHNFQ